MQPNTLHTIIKGWKGNQYNINMREHALIMSCISLHTVCNTPFHELQAEGKMPARLSALPTRAQLHGRCDTPSPADKQAACSKLSRLSMFNIEGLHCIFPPLTLTKELVDLTADNQSKKLLYSQMGPWHGAMAWDRSFPSSMFNQLIAVATLQD